MKTRKLFPKDVNNLLLLTRKLANKSPEFEDLKNFNLLPYGDAIVEVGGYFYVVDQMGKYENCRYIKYEAKKTGHTQKLAINKKSITFVQFLWNLVKMITSECE